MIENNSLSKGDAHNSLMLMEKINQLFFLLDYKD